MKNVVMGTAGHIDHGKTALVKRLTGIDTDRLEEEKRRGMTIELGFAPLTLPSGNVISVVDVPGHEKFIKTMVAGAAGIDFVMLAIAADEGVMPQTREHIDILSLLNVKSGVVALTKSDLVDEDWLGLVLEDVAKALEGTTLEGLPVIPVSSVTGAGMDILVNELEQLAVKAEGRNMKELFRLPVDRVFSITGHGTVITGTVYGGKVTRGDTVELLPAGLEARVRGIQVHNMNVETAGCGDRCALNISGVEKDDVSRGDVAAAPGTIKPSKIVDAVIYAVKGKEGITHNQRVHVNTGTKEVLARVRILGADEIPAGSKGYAQLRFEEPVAVLREDRFIIRSYSPVTTIGGGWVVFHNTGNRQRFSAESINALTTGELGSREELVGHLLKSSGRLASADDIWKELFSDKDDIDKILKAGVAAGRILELGGTGKYLSKELYDSFYLKINEEFEQLYKKYPYRYQIDREEIKSRIFGSMDTKDYTALLNLFVNDMKLKLDGNYIAQYGNNAIEKIAALKEVSAVEQIFYEDGLNVRSAQQLQVSVKADANRLDEICRFLVQTKKLIDLGNDILVHHVTLDSAIQKIRSIIDDKGSITAAQARDCLGAGRKMAIALMEYLDCIGITERVGDARIPGIKY